MAATIVSFRTGRHATHAASRIGAGLAAGIVELCRSVLEHAERRRRQRAAHMELARLDDDLLADVGMMRTPLGPALISELRPRRPEQRLPRRERV